MADKDRIVDELHIELNMRLELLNPGRAKPISEEAVRLILQSLEDLGYEVVSKNAKNAEVDSSQAQDLVTAITNFMPEVKPGLKPEELWAELTAVAPAILQDLASRGWKLIPPE